MAGSDRPNGIYRPGAADTHTDRRAGVAAAQSVAAVQPVAGRTRGARSAPGPVPDDPVRPGAP